MSNRINNRIAVPTKPDFTLAQRDLKLIQIKQAIQKKKQFILNKRKELLQKTKSNTYLENVKNDYETYYNQLVKQKQQQYEAMMLLKEYNDDIIKNSKLIDNELSVAKHTQKDLLSEISKIKKGLDELIES